MRTKKNSRSNFKSNTDITFKFQCNKATRMNRSPKGNMWSAMPVALLCMILTVSEGEQGSGPKGDKVP